MSHQEDTGLFLEEIVRETRTFYCLECGKCSSVCPVSRRNPSFLPWTMVEDALLGCGDDLIHDRELFTCLTCYACRPKCPSDVDYPLFVRKVRMLAANAGEHGNQSHCGTIQCLARFMANPAIKQQRLGWLTEEYSVSDRADVLFFVGCAPYLQHVFTFDARPLDIAKASLRILNVSGVSPMVLADEKCCGHDALWAGDIELFEKLAEHNAARIRESGARKLVFSCPECYRTFQEDYPNFVTIDCELQHISEFVLEQLGEGKIKFKEINKQVTYHDSCRLGRHLGVYEQPRKVLGSIPGLELVEMERNRERALCCGTSAFTNCDSYSMQIQSERLQEAKATGAELLITTCPKCQIHFRCTMESRGRTEGPDIDIEVVDIANLVASALEGASCE